MLSSAAPVYDWRELKRWNISEDRLPSGSVVEFREPSLWEQYRWYLIGSIVLILLQAVLITGLIVNGLKRHRAEKALLETQELVQMATTAGGLGLK
jgi:hypothetical protein